MVKFDPTFTVAALMGAAGALFGFLNWRRGWSRARVDIWVDRGMRADEPAVCFRIHNSGAVPLAPRAFLASKSRFRRPRERLVTLGSAPVLAPTATFIDYFADARLSCLDEVRSLAFLDGSGRRYRVRRRQLREVQQRCRELRASPRFADGVMRPEAATV
jgi:hypothetical protein